MSELAAVIFLIFLGYCFVKMIAFIFKNINIETDHPAKVEKIDPDTRKLLNATKKKLGFMYTLDGKKPSVGDVVFVKYNVPAYKNQTVKIDEVKFLGSNSLTDRVWYSYDAMNTSGKLISVGITSEFWQKAPETISGLIKNGPNQFLKRSKKK